VFWFSFNKLFFLKKKLAWSSRFVPRTKWQSSHCCPWFILVRSSDSITQLVIYASTIASPAASAALPEPYTCHFTPSRRVKVDALEHTLLHSLGSGSLHHLTSEDYHQSLVWHHNVLGKCNPLSFTLPQCAKKHGATPCRFLVARDGKQTLTEGG